MSDTHSPADKLREAYSTIEAVCDKVYLSKLEKKAITDAFLEIACDYALAAAEADALRERAGCDTSIPRDELATRARAYYPPDLPTPKAPSSEPHTKSPLFRAPTVLAPSSEGGRGVFTNSQTPSA